MEAQRAEPVSPLDEAFLPTLLGPARATQILTRQPSWKRIADDLASLYLQGRAYWPSGDRGQGDPPSWALQAIRKLMHAAPSIFRYASRGDHTKQNVVMICRAKSEAGGHRQMTDAQALAGLAMAEAHVALRELARAVVAMSEDTELFHWVSQMHHPSWRWPEWRAEIGGEVDAAIDLAGQQYIEPNLDYIGRHRTHGERLLELAEILARGEVDGAEVKRLEDELASLRLQLHGIEANRERARTERSEVMRAAKSKAKREAESKGNKNKSEIALEHLKRLRDAGENVFEWGVTGTVALAVGCEREHVRKVRAKTWPEEARKEREKRQAVRESSKVKKRK